MAPNLLGSTATLFLEATQEDVRQSKKSTEPTPSTPKTVAKKSESNETTYEWKIVWHNVIAFLYLHLGALYGIYLFFVSAKLLTFVWTMTVASTGAVGITAGAHRLWAHRAYKAKWPLRVLLMICQTMAFQNHLSEWVRDHRVHHKFTDTNADPHNAKRGFFFSHIGWLLVRKHPDVITKGATVDVSDLEKDPVVVWQRRLYVILMPVFCFLIPTWVPCHFWGETAMNSWYCAAVFRYTLSLNLTWLVNSAAHIWGMKPYDDSISPTDDFLIAVGAFGEGWHNYHHVFPWDYKAAELGNYRANFSTALIDFFAWVGWAYDLKSVPIEMVNKRAARTGDGSRTRQNEHYGHSHEGAIWGWGDADMHSEDIADAHIERKGV
ncbi:acyl-CoA Delta-9 desaturase-like isoform X2 [Athalia rosae]|nr:acyl-CoA Delta-9 desaturase-like isoform X2 [Athalia rosae]XP_048513302.1 acyl-CoA Delta-9 desaturase-like isoform X2 [Athalia rosae]